MTEITNDRQAAVNGGADGSAAPDDVAPIRDDAPQQADEVSAPSDSTAAPLTELEYAVVDVETTGFTPDQDAITEIGAVRVSGGRVVAEFTSLVNPGTPVPEQIAQLTGISDQMLAPAPPVAAVLPGLLAFADGCVLTAHNAPFDVKFLRAAFTASGLDWPGYPVLDTLRLARQLMRTPDEVRDCKLGTLADFFGTPVQPTHRALADARATASVLDGLLARLAEHGVTTLGELVPWLEEREAAQAAAATEAKEAEKAREAAEADARRPRWLRPLRSLRWFTRMVRRPRPPRQPR